MYVTATQLMCGIAKDLTKLGGKTVTKLVTPGGLGGCAGQAGRSGSRLLLHDVHSGAHAHAQQHSGAATGSRAHLWTCCAALQRRSRAHCSSWCRSSPAGRTV